MLNTTKSTSDFSDLLSRFQVEFHQDCSHHSSIPNPVFPKIPVVLLIERDVVMKEDIRASFLLYH